MRSSLHGRVSGPCAVVVGTWDPFIPAHRQLIEECAADAHGNALASVVVLIDPSPSVFVWGSHDWPIYDEVKTRMELIFSCGVDAILCVHFTKADLSVGAAEFFTLLEANLSVAELWLGTFQTFGAGARGRTAVVNELAEERGIRLVRLPPIRLETNDVRKLLAAGRVHEASRIVGRPPVRWRPRAPAIRLAWLPGQYSVVPLASPLDDTAGQPLAIELVAQPKGLSSLQWPDRQITYLAFVAGPGDTK